MREIGSDDPASNAVDLPEDTIARVRYLLDAAHRAHEEAARARRLAGSQTQADVVSELKRYADQLERQASLFDQQAAEFADKLATTRRLTEGTKELADKAHSRLQEMADRLKKPQ